MTMAAISSNATPPKNGWFTKFEILGKPPTEEQMCSMNLISPNYFSALQIPLLQGRIWSEDENQNGALVAVINRTMAQRYFPNGDTLGHSVKMPAIEDRPPAELSAPNSRNPGCRLSALWRTLATMVWEIQSGRLSTFHTRCICPWARGSWSNHRRRRSCLVHSIRTQLMSSIADQQAYNNITELETWITDETEWQQGRLVSWDSRRVCRTSPRARCCGSIQRSVIYRCATYKSIRDSHGARSTARSRSANRLRIHIRQCREWNSDRSRIYLRLKQNHR